MSRKTVILTLMISGLALLIVLQVFWLRGTYERSYFGLRREINFHFRSALYGLRDSLAARSLVPITGDSVPGWSGSRRMEVRINSSDSPPPEAERDSSDIQVFFSSEVRVDTLRQFIAPLTSQLRRRSPSGSSRFLIRMGPDTLNMRDLRAEFMYTLAAAGIDLPFELHHEKSHSHDFFPVGAGVPFSRERTDTDPRPSVYSDSLRTETYAANPMHRYAATMGDVRSLLLGRIHLEILFSLFVTTMIGGAFLLMFRSLRAQERLMEMKNDFIRNVTHELKTPVATVSVALEALASFRAMNSPEKTDEYLSIARHELERLNLLTDKVLKTAIFEDKGIVFSPESVDLSAVADKVVNSFRLLFDREKASLTLKKEGSNFTLRGSEDHLTNMLYNLVENAFKYSPSLKEVSVTLRASERQIEVFVADKGIGIDAAYHKRIFEKFFRIPNGDVHTFKGHGLGLSYVAGVVRAHQGTVLVASEPGKGSIFTVTLPVNNGHQGSLR
jgi:signal transduction histidine kinase